MIRETEIAAASVPTPPANKKTLFLDAADGDFKTKDESGTVESLIGPTGPAGANGSNGTNGVGVPVGGTAGQYLRKQSGTDYDTAFAAIAESEVTNLVTDLAAKAALAGATFTGPVEVPNDAYDATTWNGSAAVPTKNAVRDKIEALSVAGISASIVDAKGDLIAATADNAVARLAVGTDGQRLKADSGQATGLAWTNEVAAIPFVIDGGGAVIATGVKGDLEIPFAGTITGWTVLGDQSGSITIDTWKDTYANFPPTVADTMWGTKPNLSAAAKNQATGLSIAVAAGDIIRFNVDSAATVTRVTLSFTITKS